MGNPIEAEHRNIVVSILKTYDDLQTNKKLPTQLLWDILKSGKLNDFSKLIDLVCDEIRLRNDNPKNQLNDLFGGESGDDLLKKISNQLLSRLFRMGGNFNQCFDACKKIL